MAGTKKSSKGSRGSSSSPARTKKVKPLNERFKPGDIVWTRMKGFPWWPSVVYTEKDAPSKVKRAKKSGRVLVVFLESNSFNWTSEKNICKFRGAKYDEYSDDSRKNNDWKRAFKLCIKYEKGEFEIPEIESEGESESETEVKVGKKRKRASPTRAKKVQKTSSSSNLRKARSTSPKRKKSTSTPKKSPTRKSPKGSRKKKVVLIPFSQTVIADITTKLSDYQDLQDDETKDSEIYTLLYILSKCQIEAENLKVIPLQFICDLSKHRSTQISKLADSLFSNYKKSFQKSGIAKSSDKKDEDKEENEEENEEDKEEKSSENKSDKKSEKKDENNDSKSDDKESKEDNKSDA